MRACQRCKIRKCKPQTPRMAQLPTQRLTPFIRAFTNVGVDYLGPIDVVNARRKEKRYVAVFTCLVTRAVHLEVAHSLSTESYSLGEEVHQQKYFRTMEPVNIACATTFTDTHTTWTFNPPSAPHMGGVWERLVRSVKEGLRALDDGRRLNDEMLMTVLIEVESLINTRPLTYMPQTSSDTEALTPNHFLLGSSAGRKEKLRIVPEPAVALRSSYQRAIVLAEAIWDRWLKEYVPTLNNRTKWLERRKQLEPGDLVRSQERLAASDSRRNFSWERWDSEASSGTHCYGKGIEATGSEVGGYVLDRN
uniref:DUF5641 domain-containing protein n=1 Tax=Anopheles minimus TaxID=112268 RepID=A0A182W695_9DIPT